MSQTKRPITLTQLVKIAHDPKYNLWVAIRYLNEQLRLRIRQGFPVIIGNAGFLERTGLNLKDDLVMRRALLAVFNPQRTGLRVTYCPLEGTNWQLEITPDMPAPTPKPYHSLTLADTRPKTIN